MDEWMHLTSGEATYRQQEQQAMRRSTHAQQRSGSGQRIRTALATALIALAARVAPTPKTSLSVQVELIARTQS